MATIVNKRQHQLRDGAVLLLPGENTIDNEVWNKTKVAGSQLELWLSLNWIAQKRALPIAPAEPATSVVTSAAAVEGARTGVESRESVAPAEDSDSKRGRRK